MRQMTRGLQAYIAAVAGAGAVATLLALVAAPPKLSPHGGVLAVLLVVLTALAHAAPIMLDTKRGLVFSTALHTVAILTLPLGEAVPVCALGALLGNCYLHRPWFNALFNGAQVAVSVAVAGAVYAMVAPNTLAVSDRDLHSVAGLLPAGVALFLVSSLAVDGAAAIQHRRSPFADWLAVRGPSMLAHVVLVMIGAIAATAIRQEPWLALFTVAPVAVVRSMMRVSLRFDADTVRTAEEIAGAVDARHGDSGTHSRYVSILALRIAQHLGLPEDECQQIYLAARLRDVGASLTTPPAPHEWDEETSPHTNTEESALFVERKLRLPRVAEMIRLHLERFDGRGFPRGLVGEDIPLGSRVVSVADAWAALTSRRGYRPALSAGQALVVLRAGAGTQWDPAVVEAVAALIAEVDTRPLQIPGSHAPVRALPRAVA
jgi:hypothetical protein